MKRELKSLFATGKVLIGVIHLRPLPGSPRWQGSMDAVLEQAAFDARAYERGGADAVVVENFGDLPFTRSAVAPETVAAMALAGRAVRETIRLPLGFNVLRNDALAGLALCAACSGTFIRVNVLTGVMVTDQGIIEGQAYEILRRRAQLCPATQIFADVHVKHAAPLADVPLDAAARDTLERGLADALIVSGAGTGLPTDPADVRTVRNACPTAKILIGSGSNLENVGRLIEWADGLIVGSSLKKNGRLENRVDERRVAALRKRMVRCPSGNTPFGATNPPLG